MDPVTYIPGQQPAAQAPQTPAPQPASPTAPTPLTQAQLTAQNGGVANLPQASSQNNNGAVVPNSSPTGANITINTGTDGAQAPKTNLQPGQQGQDVSNLQSFLTSLGYMTPAQTATGPGMYGPQTQHAVATLQKDLGVNAGQGSGFYGPQTQDAIAKKYQDAFKNASGAAPTNAADAASALEKNFQDNSESTTGADAQQAYFEKLFGMNPVESTIFSQLSNLTSQTNTQTSLSDLYTQESAAQGLPGLNLQFADINKIMRGTEDDIRQEVGAAGGGASESQIQALTGARNKVLMNQAQYLQDVINSKNDYVDKVVQLTGQDRAAVSQQISQKLGILNTMETITSNAENAAKDNFKSIIDAVGWDGLAASVKNNPTQAAKIESLFGMSPGELQSIAAYNSPQEQQQSLQMQNLQLQNKKLQADLSAGPAISSQVVNMGTAADPHYKLINTKTGAVISDYGSTQPTGKSPQAIALQQQSIQDTQSLLSNPGLSSAVGPNYLARIGPIAAFSGAKSNFIAGVQQLQQGLTLTNLQNAKTNGATFGALSEGELNLLSQSSTKLGSWSIKDNAGNVIGYNTDEADFKAELNKINNFQKLDFVLKGGDPSSVGLQQMPDGTLWSENSDGSKTQIQ